MAKKELQEIKELRKKVDEIQKELTSFTTFSNLHSVDNTLREADDFFAGKKEEISKFSFEIVLILLGVIISQAIYLKKYIALGLSIVIFCVTLLLFYKYLSILERKFKKNKSYRNLEQARKQLVMNLRSIEK